MHAEPTESGKASSTWRPAQAYTLAVVCLLVGLPIGYLIRGSAPPAQQTVASAPPSAEGGPTAGMPASAPAKMPTLDDMKRMADKQVQPELAELQSKPNDPALLNQIGLSYKAAHQFKEAASYFKRSLDSDPANVAVRADYASCLYYTGDVDGALAQLDKSLTYDPKHAGTLFNIGMIKWKGKGDVDGAVAAWRKLLKLNPNMQGKEQIEQLIDQALKSKGPSADGQKS
jgi:cytochrome c-type biogenesis protein CcmH/NrfG